jgi:hypothetical protein
MKHPPLDGLWELKQEADRERAFFEAHHQEFAQKYPDQFVAVHEGRVIAVSDDPGRLVALIREQEYEPRKVWTDFIQVTYERWIL